VAFVNQRHVTEGKVNEAITTVINGYNQFPLPKIWGLGKHASADGTKWDLHDRQRELVEVFTLHAERDQGATKLGDRGLFGIVDQLVFRPGVLLVLKVGYEAGLRVVIVATP
jgi:Tn3 transposase DDE domain